MGQMQTIAKHKTRITTENGITVVRYHDTDVVTFDDETIRLDAGGWQSVTIKARMNQTANEYDLGFYVYQKAFDWFVTTKAGTVAYTGRILIFDRETMRLTTWNAE